MSEESSKQLKKRGQPNHFPTGNQKTNKRITDQKARLENREIVVKLTEAAPIVKQLLEAFSSINEGNLLQTVTYIRERRFAVLVSSLLSSQTKDHVTHAMFLMGNL
ncbi:uncharacterized protein [Gossypium hirsutum]|uniref:Uncharacterized protein n=1 Tax=Gossypium hirsutum TaxID=3635 RepID=A0A1U8K5U3_GOSHI|nr:uncharacterized protein LOC107913741 [Gossypium hirsutum]